MNCKQGDLAVIVFSKYGNEGKLLTCLRLASAEECADESFWNWKGPVWVTDAVIQCNDRTTTHLYPDSRLTPLRYSDGEDEMLRIAGVPVTPEPVLP